MIGTLAEDHLDLAEELATIRPTHRDYTWEVVYVAPRARSARDSP